MGQIEWTDRSDWNPIRGCTRVSEGCRSCYAEAIAARFSGPGQPFEGYAKKVAGEARWTGKVGLIEERLTLPLKWRKPSRIFVNSASDLFHESVPDEWIDKVFAIMALAPQHTFQLLSKRSKRMREYIRSLTYGTSGMERFLTSRLPDGRMVFDAVHQQYKAMVPWPLPNVWLGVSAEDQQRSDERIPDLLATPAAVRFVSAEPLLGPIDFRSICPEDTQWNALTGVGYSCGHSDDCRFTHPKLDWIIAGGESGPSARPSHPDWHRSIRDQCAAAGVAFFFKQHGEWADTHSNWPRAEAHAIAHDGTLYKSTDLAYPDGKRRGEAIRAGHDNARLCAIYRVGKSRAGRLLDGRTHDEFPEVK